MPESACKIARQRSKSHTPTSEPGMCLREVRECFGIGHPVADDAAEAWAYAQHRHTETNPRHFPRNVPVFWTGGRRGHGHIAISVGRDTGHVWSTDILRPGYFDRVPIDLISSRWGLRLVGWTEDLGGIRLWSK